MQPCSRGQLRSTGVAGLWRAAFALLAAVLIVAALPPAAAASTFVGDKQALLAFKEGLTEPSPLLEGWSWETDPCTDKWTGIKCDCKDYFYSVGSSEVGAGRRELCTLL